MAPKRKRNRRRNRDDSDSGVAEATPIPSRSSTPKRERRTRTRRRSRSQQGDSNTVLWFVLGGAALIVVFIGAVVISAANGGGSVNDFDIAVYQGENELGGSNVNFRELIAREEPIVLNFWAGDCFPCRAEMPALQRVYNKHKEDLTFVGLDVGVFSGLGTERNAKDLLEELNISYPAGTPSGRTPMSNFSVTAMPTTIFIGRDGKVFQRWDGAISEGQMNAIVEDMVEQTPS